MQIVNLKPEDTASIQQAAMLLVEGFKTHWPEAALETVQASFGPDRLSRVAIDDAGRVLGWIGGIQEYSGHAWELHPLVVAADQRGRGIGRALVLDLEELVRQHGGQTLFLGSDDEDNMTSLAGINLYPNPLEHLANLKNLRGHPFEFYQKLGFVVVGVLPDANGLGKPDILMAKSLVDRRP
jgi:aminoglycoside 6'-N-acetyltransferase I